MKSEKRKCVCRRFSDKHIIVMNCCQNLPLQKVHFTVRMTPLSPRKKQSKGEKPDPNQFKKNTQVNLIKFKVCIMQPHADFILKWETCMRFNEGQ